MNTKQHGGKRENAGRKPLPDEAKKQTAVVRVPVELLPMVEQLKQGSLVDTPPNRYDIEDSAEVERLKQRGVELVEQRDKEHLQVIRLKSELETAKREPMRLKVELSAAKRELDKHKQQSCQCLTAKGFQCEKRAGHEIKTGGFIVWMCEQHYKKLTLS